MLHRRNVVAFVVAFFLYLSDVNGSATMVKEKRAALRSSVTRRKLQTKKNHATIKSAQRARKKQQLQQDTEKAEYEKKRQTALRELREQEISLNKKIADYDAHHRKSDNMK